MKCNLENEGVVFASLYWQVLVCYCNVKKFGYERNENCSIFEWIVNGCSIIIHLSVVGMILMDCTINLNWSTKKIQEKVCEIKVESKV